MQVSDFDYHLPPELIAQYPALHREESRMLVLHRNSGLRTMTSFTNFPSYLRPGDCLVLNDTRVIPARLLGNREGSGGRVEAFLLEVQKDSACWQALLRPGRRLPPGSKVIVNGSEGSFTVEEKLADGTFLIRFSRSDVLNMLEQCGQVPLPPYINRAPEKDDKERYQTVYAAIPGAVAAPTAGLHFTEGILSELASKGVQIVRLTLHVGAGTFKPVEVANIEDHVMHEETYSLSEKAASLINRTRQNGGKVFCVGTTTVRVLETCVDRDSGRVQAGSGRTSIFLYPPKKPLAVDGLLTNFHLPKSTLLMLVCTFCEQQHVFAAYAEAIQARMRFFSYGDCMLLQPEGR
ncbi:MAG: tRNA preQ1(34) S-adenosylmethionine ribosyltransferase-isomerase QueA [Lentisphaeria bacterium]|nr:tRNA preQ1(34) S-adenosylmethionine ribosyltransferase-isomerase QueA [Lentisphaeria bacterium]